jgi:hypothetical protein
MRETLVTKTHGRRRKAPQLLFVIGWVLLLGGVVFFGLPAYYHSQLPPPLQDEPVTMPLPVPVTDVADAYARYRIMDFRDAARSRLGQDDAMFDTCSERSADEVRLAYGGGWGNGSFVLTIRATVDGARARWLPVDLYAPPPPPPPPGRPGIAVVPPLPAPDASSIASQQEETRSLTPTSWTSLRARVLAPGFLRLPTVNESGADGFLLTIETCTGGHYHFVSRWSPRPPQDDEFLHVADAIVAAAGRVHDVAHVVVDTSRPETARKAGR